MSANETIADIVLDMRIMFNKSWHDIDRERARGLADRIEAAVMREPGNAAAMREALVEVKKRIIDATTRRDWSTDDAHFVCNTIEAAIAKPPRNCDVGTPDEQGERFEQFCHAAGWDNCSKTCPLYAHSRNRDDCAIQWANMLFTNHASNVNKPSAVDNGHNKEQR